MTYNNFAEPQTLHGANHRKAIRYGSKNSKAIATFKPLLLPKKYINIEVINISSKGARIGTKFKFSRRDKIVFNLKIDKNSVNWKIPAKVVRIYRNSEYGIVFDDTHHDLIDHIMKNEADFNIV